MLNQFLMIAATRSRHNLYEKVVVLTLIKFAYKTNYVQEKQGKMIRQNHSIAFASLFTQISIPLIVVAPLVLLIGERLALTVSAAPPANTQRVVALLPPPPPSNFTQKERSPREASKPRELDFRAPVASKPNPYFESYLVYVEDASALILKQVKQVEPKAFVRQYQGHSVIQVGVFKQKCNAQQRVRELAIKAIWARLFSVSTGKETNFKQEEDPKPYFVVIRDDREDLPLIEAQVKQLRGNIPVSVSQAEKPRPHVRIGPFLERRLADRWKHYLVNSGLKNARVYHGR